MPFFIIETVWLHEICCMNAPSCLVSEITSPIIISISYSIFRLDAVSPYLARQFIPFARTFMNDFVSQRTSDNNDQDLESDIEEEEGQEDSYNEAEEKGLVELQDIHGNKVYSAVQVEDLLSRCLAAISNRKSILSK
jgi:hypothetical protein